MTALPPNEIRAILFDLDGTLYECERFAGEIQSAAAEYIAGVRKISRNEAELLMADTRQRLADESGNVQTLSAVCTELGGTVQDLHRFFENVLRPEAYLVRDERVIQLLKDLGKRFALYLYTNNNRVLATRIINYLGLDGLMNGMFAIDDTWMAKPNEDVIVKILAEAGISPSEGLFVGDRYDVDLRVPEQLGCPVYLSQSVEQLLRLGGLLQNISKTHLHVQATLDRQME